MRALKKAATFKNQEYFVPPLQVIPITYQKLPNIVHYFAQRRKMDQFLVKRLISLVLRRVRIRMRMCLLLHHTTTACLSDCKIHTICYLFVVVIFHVTVTINRNYDGSNINHANSTAVSDSQNVQQCKFNASRSILIDMSLQFLTV